MHAASNAKHHYYQDEEITPAASNLKHHYYHDEEVQSISVTMMVVERWF